MKINPNTPKQHTTKTQGPEQGHQAGTSSTQASGSQTSRPEPHPTIATARLLDRAFKVLKETPVVDIGHVDLVRRQLSQGSYAIDDQRTSERLIENERALEG